MKTAQTLYVDRAMRLSDLSFRLRRRISFKGDLYKFTITAVIGNWLLVLLLEITLAYCLLLITPYPPPITASVKGIQGLFLPALEGTQYV